MLGPKMQAEKTCKKNLVCNVKYRTWTCLDQDNINYPKNLGLNLLY